MSDRIKLMRGDITKLAVDTIVNAANTSLLGGGGVDGAIHRAAGPDLLKECRTLGGCPTGSAKITRGYGLPATYVIHAVGPVYRDGKHGEPELLAGCYRTALKLAAENACKSIAFPAISCGIYGYPMADAAAVALREVLGFLGKRREIKQAVFVLFDEYGLKIYQQVYDDLLKDIGEAHS